MEQDRTRPGTIRLGDVAAKQFANARVINGRYAIGPKSLPGGISEVHKAVDLSDDHRQVAVKLFGQGTVPEEVIKESYRRELQALGDLRHENIVALLDHGTDGETGK